MQHQDLANESIHRVLQAALIIVASVALTACHATLDVRVDVNRDGGGTVAATVIADAALSQAAADAAYDPIAVLTEAELPDGWRSEHSTAPTGETTFTVSSRFSDVDEFARRYAELQQGLNVDGAQLVGPLTLQHNDDGTFTVDGEATMIFDESHRALAVQATPEHAESISQYFASTITVSTPGVVQESNADTVVVDGTSAQIPTEGAATMQWNAREAEAIPVAASFEEGGTPWLTWLLYAVGGLVAVGLIAAGIKQRGGQRRR